MVAAVPRTTAALRAHVQRAAGTAAERVTGNRLTRLVQADRHRPVEWADRAQPAERKHRRRPRLQTPERRWLRPAPSGSWRSSDFAAFQAAASAAQKSCTRFFVARDGGCRILRPRSGVADGLGMALASTCEQPGTLPIVGALLGRITGSRRSTSMRSCALAKPAVRFYNLVHGTAHLEEKLVCGLKQTEKQIPSSLLYDARGARLFDRLAQAERFSPTAGECRLIRAVGPLLKKITRGRPVVVEYGSGTSQAGLALLAASQRPTAYVPVDLSLACLKIGVARVRRRLAWLRCIPVRADFTSCFALPRACARAKESLVYVSSSAFGTLSETAALRLLDGAAGLCGRRGGILIGVDLRSEPTADELDDNLLRTLNLNAIASVNRQFRANFRVDRFEHAVAWNESDRRVELRLVSRERQVAKIGRHKFALRQGEVIRTENAQRYRWRDIERISREAGLVIEDAWFADDRRLALVHLKRCRER